MVDTLPDTPMSTRKHPELSWRAFNPDGRTPSPLIVRLAHAHVIPVSLRGLMMMGETEAMSIF